MRGFEILPPPSEGPGNSRWIHAFLVVGIYPLLALWDWPPGVRPWLLTGGSLLCVVVAAVTLFAAIKEDRLLLVFVVAVLLFWLAAFPAAINANDDNTAYLVFAKDFYHDLASTIQPLSERRLFSVGGNYAFQAPVIHWVGVGGLSLVEPVLGLILIFIVASARQTTKSFAACYFVVGVLALVPLGGSKVLANTASVFVLAAFTLALLELGRSILDKRTVTWPEVMLLMVLPISASVFRPTTAPFNVLMAGLIALYVVVSLQEFRKVLISAGLALALLCFALLPYHETGGTYLYPILGRGFHATADGYSIAASLSSREHLTNVATVALADPLLLLNFALAATLAWINAASIRRMEVVTTAVVYLGFYGLIVVTTGGLGSARYAFPVSLAIAVSLLLMLLEQVSIFPLSQQSRLTAFAKMGWMAGVVGCLVLVRLTVGPAVIDKRLEVYEPARDVLSNIDAVQAIANRKGEAKGATLLISTGYERFIVDKLAGAYFIMDQPGLMSPWTRHHRSYAEGLDEFIVANNIRTIVTNTVDCEHLTAQATSGWSGLMRMGRLRNDRAICGLAYRYVVTAVGPFTVFTRGAIQSGRSDGVLIEAMDDRGASVEGR